MQRSRDESEQHSRGGNWNGSKIDCEPDIQGAKSHGGRSEIHRASCRRDTPKTNAKVITLHVKKVKAASSADTTDAEKKEKIAGLHLAFTMVVGESSGLTYQFKTDDTRVDKVQVGQDYTVVLGMAYLDIKKHKVNVKDRNSAVIFVPNGDRLVQFTLKIDAVEEK